MTLLLNVFWHMVRQVVRFRALDGAVLETTNTIEFCFFEPVEEHLEVFFGFTGEADNEGRAQHKLRADFAPLLDTRQCVFGVRRAGRAVCEPP